MYQKEIIYMGLYKNGTRIGSAGFVKVESHEQDSRLYLKTQNIPHSINGRFPIRVYNGSEWKEINGIMIQDGSGVWEERLAGRASNAVLQVMLPGGYLLEGKSRLAAQPQQGTEMHSESAEQQGTEARNEVAMPGKIEAYNETAMPIGTERHNETVMQRGREVHNEIVMPAEAEAHNEIVMQRGTETLNGTAMPRETEMHSETIMPKDVKAHREAVVLEETKVRNEDLMQQDMKSHNKAIMSGDMETHNKTIMQGSMESHRGKAIGTEQMGYTDRPPVVIVKEELPRRAVQELHSMPENESDHPLKEDKWEQILDTYEQIHPYGDERVYVKIEPKDFVILQSNYQHLVNNSFLLHGFYNYRYIILGKEQDYYLGVPGVFYEREKMVALMFGFEAFECPGGNVRAGEFGYYLRKVEL